MGLPAARGRLRRLLPVGDMDLRSVGVQRCLHSAVVHRIALGTHHRNASDDRLAGRGNKCSSSATSSPSVT